MQVGTPNDVCPLCRREPTADARLSSNSTRLCKQCQLMLEPIVPGARTRVNEVFTHRQAQQLHAAQPEAFAVAGSLAYGQPFFAADDSAVASPVADDFNLESTIDGASMLEEIEEIEDDDLSYPDLEMSFEPQEEAFTIADEQAAAPISLDEIHEAEQTNDPEADRGYGFDQAEAIRQKSFKELEQSHVAVEAESSDEPSFAEPAQIGAQENLTGQKTEVENGEIQQPAAADYNSATDPWNEPLPAWDYSHNQWPVLLEKDRSATAKRLRMPIAALLIIAVVAVAYFLIFQPSKDAAKDNSSTEAQKPLVVASPQKTENQPAPAAASSQAPAETSVSPQQPHDEAVTGPNAQGQFTLQLASMPDEKAAREAAEKMIAAGLPAYVTSADLGSRGKWFRVRVGRFGSQQEAKSFALKSRLEARVERADN